MASSSYEATFEWPHTDPTTVVVTGSFDQWSSSTHLVKNPTGFVGKARVPWGERTNYKFIVDGRWTIHGEQPTDTDPAGNVNNVLIAPEAPSVVPAEVDISPAVLPTPAAEILSTAATTNGHVKPEAATPEAESVVAPISDALDADKTKPLPVSVSSTLAEADAKASPADDRLTPEPTEPSTSSAIATIVEKAQAYFAPAVAQVNALNESAAKGLETVADSPPPEALTPAVTTVELTPQESKPPASSAVSPQAGETPDLSLLPITAESAVSEPTTSDMAANPVSEVSAITADGTKSPEPLVSLIPSAETVSTHIEHATETLNTTIVEPVAAVVTETFAQLEIPEKVTQVHNAVVEPTVDVAAKTLEKATNVVPTLLKSEATNGDAAPAPTATGELKDHAAADTFSQRISAFTDTVLAREGAGSPYEYISSGIGAAIQGVVGIDPINADKIDYHSPMPDAEFIKPEPEASPVASDAGLSSPVFQAVNNAENNDPAPQNINSEALATHSPVNIASDVVPSVEVTDAAVSSPVALAPPTSAAPATLPPTPPFKEETGSSTPPAVQETSQKAHVASATPPRTPSPKGKSTAPDALHSFPTSGSPGGLQPSPSGSSRFNSLRKKRPSIFGKIKGIFSPEKEKEKGKKGSSS